MIKRLFISFLLVAAIVSTQQVQAQHYEYKAPEGWGTEKIPLPFKFATGIPYKGFEELRFAPGWGDSASTAKQRWAYTILWCLEGKQQFTEAILKKDLEAYYSGLSHMTMVDLKMDTTKWIKAGVHLSKSATAPGDKATYSAGVSFFDAHVLKKPAMLYGKIHVKNCADNAWTYVIIEMAEVPITAEVWKIMDKINSDFTCTK